MLGSNVWTSKLLHQRFQTSGRFLYAAEHERLGAKSASDSCFELSSFRLTRVLMSVPRGLSDGNFRLAFDGKIAGSS